MTRRRFLTVSGAALGFGWVGRRGLTDTPASPRNDARAASLPADVASFWLEDTLRIVRDTGATPPGAARALGYVAVAVYEVARVGMPTWRSLGGQLKALPDLPSAEPGADFHLPTVIAAATTELLPALFPVQDPLTVRIGEVRAALFDRRYVTGTPAPRLDRSRALGRAIGRSIADWSKGDGALTQDLSFPKAGRGGRHLPSPTGQWVPTGFEYAPPMLPRWGGNRTFVLPSAASVDPGSPPPYSKEPGSRFYQDALRVYKEVKAVTADQARSLLFWADGSGQSNTPAGHWIAVLGQLLREERRTLEVAAEAYALLGIALNDAAIACWYTKYRYNLVRPLTYIHEVIDPRFEPLLPTPPFPEYTSGHSVLSAAAAEILTRQFGALAYTDHTNRAFPFGRPRRFESFAAAAREAAMSRLHAGIHFEPAIERGLEQGRRVAERVLELRLRS